MKTKAVRLYGANDVRLEEFDLRPITSGEILIKIISDSVCMSTYKTILQGEKHLRVPEGIAQHPVIIGHEFCAEVVEVGSKIYVDDGLHLQHAAHNGGGGSDASAAL